MRGMYFFEDRATAQAAIDQGWGGHFAEENLTELNLQPTSEPTRVDANWITSAPRHSSGLLKTSEWITDYWAGSPAGSAPTWEIISNGYAIVQDTAIRKRAYEVVQRAFPQSWTFMEMSRIAGEAGADAGLIMPFILRRDAQLHTLTYLLDDQDFHNEHVIKKMSAHPDFGRLAHRARREQAWTLPDFRPWNLDFVFGIQGIVSQEIPIFSVHPPNQPRTDF
jgi:hypothetical protein